MEISAISQRFLTTLVLVGSLSASAWAQAIFAGAGSTPQGDYLRGLGIAAWGMGTYNLDTAKAESIAVDTGIRLNEYIAQVAEHTRREYVEQRAALSAQNKKNYEEIRQRIRESPEERDVENGDSLNAILQGLLDSKVDESTFRFAQFQVPLPVDLIRKIRFKLPETGQKFSMNRLSVKGKKKWPVAFQDDRLDGAREAYERALDKALEQAIDGKLQKATIDDLELRADDLFRRLNEVFGPRDEPRYIEAKQKVSELKATANQLTIHKIELAIGEIDKYSGTTVKDLMVFMQAHNLRFAAAENSQERRLYPELYAALIQQRDKISIPDKAPAK